jgi:hypothetical protein
MDRKNVGININVCRHAAMPYKTAKSGAPLRVHDDHFSALRLIACVKLLETVVRAMPQ